ncbi:hypothetical protein AGMMS50230_22240 [Spirochaetia bacterium]|nr:hypothetical protein AGMMS50230_22240 [Spirochaetia bacterium]
MCKNNKLQYFNDVYIYPIFHNTILFNIIPILFINLLLIIFMIICSKTFPEEINGKIILLPLAVDIIINPIFLIIGNFLNAFNSKRKNYILNILFMGFGTVLGIILYFINSKILIENLLIDIILGGTLMYWIIFFELSAVLIIGIIIQIILLLV